MTVDLSDCAGCSALATHKAVTGPFSAALVVAAGGRALLISARADGSPAGVISIPYGVQFPAPAGGTLPCDPAGRCVVSALQGDGNAILSAFELTSTGAWRDVSGNDAFRSATPVAVAADLTGDHLLDIAVQDSGGGRTVWMVFTWTGERFTVLGCAPVSPTPPAAAALSLRACLS